MTGTDKILDAINDIQIHLSGHTIILTESIKPNIEKIEAHLEKQNSRIAKLESQVVNITTGCSAIQEHKSKNLQASHNRTFISVMILGVIIAALGFWWNVTSKQDRQSNIKQQTEINGLNDKVDSMVMRGAPAIKDISPLYE